MPPSSSSKSKETSVIVVDTVILDLMGRPIRAEPRPDSEPLTLRRVLCDAILQAVGERGAPLSSEQKLRAYAVGQQIATAGEALTLESADVELLHGLVDRAFPSPVVVVPAQRMLAGEDPYAWMPPRKDQ